MTKAVPVAKPPTPAKEKPVEEDDPSIPVPPDAPCKRLGCKAVYKGSETYKAPCVHHSGVPIFHEGVSLGHWQGTALILPANSG